LGDVLHKTIIPPALVGFIKDSAWMAGRGYEISLLVLKNISKVNK